MQNTKYICKYNSKQTADYNNPDLTCQKLLHKIDVLFFFFALVYSKEDSKAHRCWFDKTRDRHIWYDDWISCLHGTGSAYS